MEKKVFSWHDDSPDAGHPDCICDLCGKQITEEQAPVVRIPESYNILWDDPDNQGRETRFHTECWFKIVDKEEAYTWES